MISHIRYQSQIDETLCSGILILDLIITLPTHTELLVPAPEFVPANGYTIARNIGNFEMLLLKIY